VVEKISTEHVDVVGVTSVGDELFVLLSRDSDQLCVYSAVDEDHYRPLRHVHLPGLRKHEYNDLVSCARRRCLYISDWNGRSIHRLQLVSGATGIWSVAGLPCGLSMTADRSLLATCHEPNKLVEVCADSGRCLREIALQPDPTESCSPWHAVRLTGGQFAVCHGLPHTGDHRVCVLDVDGRLQFRYLGVYLKR